MDLLIRSIKLVPLHARKNWTLCMRLVRWENIFSNSQESVDNLTRRTKKPEFIGSCYLRHGKFNFFQRNYDYTKPPEDMDELAQLDLDEHFSHRDALMNFHLLPSRIFT